MKSRFTAPPGKGAMSECDDRRVARREGSGHKDFDVSGPKRPGKRRSAETHPQGSRAMATEAEMSDAFHQREDGFEKRFANDEALRFRAVARRNKAVALWAAELKGLSGEAAAKYAEDFVGAQVGLGDDAVAAALKAGSGARQDRPLRSPPGQEDGRGDG